MVACSTADCAASCGLSSVGPVSGRFAQRTFCRTSQKGFGRQLLFTSQVERSHLIAMCVLWRQKQTQTFMGVRIQCMDSAHWQAYGRTIETVSISFDGCSVGVGKVSNVF